MEVKQINQLMLAMGRTGVKRIVLKKEGFELELEREERAPIRGTFDTSLDSLDENPMRQDFDKHRTSTVFQSAQEGVKASVQGAQAPQSITREDARKEDMLSMFVASPMVGTVYHAPTPQDPPFIKIGDKVDRNTVVCIIEAMKVMNEVKAGVSGILEEILVENGQPVEFGSKLFRIVPS